MSGMRFMSFLFSIDTFKSFLQFRDFPLYVSFDPGFEEVHLTTIKVITTIAIQATMNAAIKTD
jgi:hypothetical protein